MTQNPKHHWIISTPRGNSEYYRTIYTKARAKQQDWTVTQKPMLEEQALLAAIQSSNMVIHEERMMSEEYDVVLDAMQRHRDRLWKMTEQNMRSEFIGLNIMDDIRLKQIEELDLAIKQRQTRKISALTEDKIREIWWSAEIAGTEFASPAHRAVKFARFIEAKLLGIVDENKIS